MPGVENCEDAETLAFARMDPEQIKEARLSEIIALGKGVYS